MAVSIASDYAVLNVGDLRFYYGYEVTVGPEDNEEWCFQVKRGREVLFTVPWPQLPLERKGDWGEPGVCLLAGLEWVIARHPEVFTKQEPA